ncbi:hypothetical protein TELCIR_03688 [Teladorsagia circumcincta]|uniref:DNA2/NAM7 helicase-like C-terminal domain-containing protein n=1 Tax=Teladorsagia circumcincta TaxID=45464 RepID=A0A2G9UVW4_TELCI|nr:hypothetical protein TELCIR_03688 [Teladorsagia circumcincta]
MHICRDLKPDHQDHKPKQKMVRKTTHQHQQTCDNCGRERPDVQAALDDLEETMMIKAEMEHRIEVEAEMYNKCLAMMNRKIEELKALHQIVQARQQQRTCANCGREVPLDVQLVLDELGIEHCTEIEREAMEIEREAMEMISRQNEEVRAMMQIVQEKELDDPINKLLQAGRIVKSDTPWVQNTVLVKKRDGSLWFEAVLRVLGFPDAQWMLCSFLQFLPAHPEEGLLPLRVSKLIAEEKVWIADRAGDFTSYGSNARAAQRNVACVALAVVNCLNNDKHNAHAHIDRSQHVRLHSPALIRPCPHQRDPCQRAFDVPVGCTLSEPQTPFLFVDIPGTSTKSLSGSHSNEAEAAVCSQIVLALKEKNMPPLPVAIVVFYKEQQRVLAQFVKNLQADLHPVVSVQGREKDIIICLPPPTDFNAGCEEFLNELHRLNVALTRSCGLMYGDAAMSLADTTTDLAVVS